MGTNGKETQTGTVTELQNKRHENKNMEQNQKQTLHFYIIILGIYVIMLTFHAIIMI